MLFVGVKGLVVCRGYSFLVDVDVVIFFEFERFFFDEENELVD